MSLILRMSRLFVAMTLLMTGPSGPVYAGLAGTQPSHKSGGSAQARSNPRHLQIPLYFEANRGQTDASVKFLTRAAGYNLFLTASEAVMVMPGAASAKGAHPAVVRMQLKGANARAAFRGRDILPGRSSYFIGKDPSKWQVGVEQYAKVAVSQVYPGIDMVYYGNQGNVEHDFVVAPGANPGRILIGFEGATGLRLDPRGNLILSVPGGELTYKAPTLYQMRGGQRTHVNGRFVLAGNKHVRFAVGDYLRNKALVIDPALAYSSFLGGATGDYAYAIDVDSLYNAYVTGKTESLAFPTAGTPTAPLTAGAGAKAAMDIFVSKVNPAGTALLWSLYIGGAGDDVGRGIAVGSAGKVYITGDTTASGSLPVTLGRLGTGAATGFDGFVMGINDAGGTSPALIYSIAFGGPADDTGYGIAADALDAVYVTGQTTSIAANSFPVTALGAQPLAGGGASQAFVLKLTAAGAQVFGTYLGGTGVASGKAIAVDSTLKVYVTGQTGNEFFTASDWPSAFKPTITGSLDAFIAKLDFTGATWLYKTYVGGSGVEDGTGIAVDSASTPNIYITGWTNSSTLFPGSGFVTTGQTTLIGNPDAFVFKLRPLLTGAGDGVYATYFGGSGDTRATGIAVDSAFNAYVTGTTTAGDIPAVDPIAGGAVLQGTPEAFVAQWGPTGAVRGFTTYLGGTTETHGQGLALDSLNNIYVTGYTNSASATFPIVAGGFQSLNGGGVYDGFVSKIGVAAPPPVCTITGISPGSGFTIGGTTVTVTGTNFVNSGPAGVTFDAVNASTYTVISATQLTAVSPRHPLIGTLTAGGVPLTVTTTGGSCSVVYDYLVSPGGGPGACGDDFFFPSPATGPTGTFAYCMERAGTARIRVYNVIGDLVAKVEDYRAAGAQTSSLNTARLAPGVYLYRLQKDYGGGSSVTSKVRKFVVKH